MSGYGVPQGPTPGSPRSAKRAPALPVLELVGVGLAVLAFIIAFLPWATPVVPDGVDIDNDVNASGWELPLPTAITTLLLVAALLVASRLLTRSKADTTTDDRPAASPVSVRPDADALGDCANEKDLHNAGFPERLKGFEPSTFCMASSTCDPCRTPIFPANAGFSCATAVLRIPRLSTRNHGSLGTQLAPGAAERLSERSARGRG